MVVSTIRADIDTRRLYLFSHPNHEIAVYGSVQRFKPDLIYLTDGGGPERVGQTRTGLDAIQCGKKAHFLDYPESLLYAKLLERDMAFFDDATGRIAALIERLVPDAIYCDAVEFYNPVHDLALPLTLAAADRAGWNGPIYEIPLVFQLAEDTSYRFQTPRPDWTGGIESLALSEAETDAKLSAARGNYTLLKDQLGGAFDAITAEQAGTETFMGPVATFPLAGESQNLRYEWRARKLLEEGSIEAAITYRDHFRPIAAHLCRADMSA